MKKHYNIPKMTFPGNSKVCKRKRILEKNACKVLKQVHLDSLASLSLKFNSYSCDDLNSVTFIFDNL